jgi:hypothetical protein
MNRVRELQRAQLYREGENMRNLHEVIDQIVAVAPDLKDVLAGTRQSCVYQPPECQPELWNRAALVLNLNAAEHPKKAEIAAIFSGKAAA